MTTESVTDHADAAAAGPSRRALTVTALVTLLGGVAAVVSAGRQWAHATAGHDALTVRVTASGGDLSGAVSALGLAALAGALALFATARWGRLVVAGLLAADGIGLVVAAVGARGAAHTASVLDRKASAKGVVSGISVVGTDSWYLLAVAGGVLIAAAGAYAAVFGRHWPGMSSRYEKTADGAAGRDREREASPKGLWDALDRGEDPTSGG